MALPAFAILMASCAGDGDQLGIRAIPDPLTKATRAGNPLIAEARGLLALGSVGLASEAFRKVLREQPGNVEALAGLAECYDRMGRHDLSRSKYEAALAIAPRNAILLRTFAASLQRQGRRLEANALQAEADQADAAEVAALARDFAPPLPQAAPEPARQVAAVVNETVRVEARPVEKRAPIGFQPPAPAELSAKTGAAPAATPVQPRSVSITVKLPPARPAPANGAAPTMNKVAERLPEPMAAVAGTPRLERLSLAEVALVTTTQPRWRAEVVRRTASSTTVRFVPLAELRRGSGVRLLNAARYQGLAARTRVALNRKGWNRVSIGDAAKVRERSLVLYSPATMAAAQKLAAEFGFGIARESRPGPLTVLLGRDAVRAAARS
jgi:hypothetical protein